MSKLQDKGGNVKINYSFDDAFYTTSIQIIYLIHRTAFTLAPTNDAKEANSLIRAIFVIKE